MATINETTDAPHTANTLYTLREGDRFVGVLSDPDTTPSDRRDTVAVIFEPDRTYYLTEVIGPDPLIFQTFVLDDIGNRRYDTGGYGSTEPSIINVPTAGTYYLSFNSASANGPFPYAATLSSEVARGETTLATMDVGETYNGTWNYVRDTDAIAVSLQVGLTYFARVISERDTWNFSISRGDQSSFSSVSYPKLEPDGNRTAFFTPTESGRHLITAAAAFDEGPDEYEIQITPEVANNITTRETIALAHLSVIAGRYSGTFEYTQDEDWIAMRLFEGYTYRFAYDDDVQTTLLAIRDAEGQRLVDTFYYSADSTLDTEILSFTPDSTGLYYFSTRYFPGPLPAVALPTVAPYSITVTVTGIEITSPNGRAFVTGALNDAITGSAEADEIRSGGGNDTIHGANGDDRLFGLGGSDRLSGGPGNDDLNGGNGNDTLDGGNGNDTLDGGVGFDSLLGDDGQDTLFGLDGFDTLDGGEGDDQLFGNNGFDVLSGGFGNDTLVGGLGLDTLLGDEGDDMLSGQGGADSLDGGAGDDTMYGNASNDTLVGGTGNDLLQGGFADDRLDGGTGNDSVMGGNGRDVLIGGPGLDILDGGSGADTLNGGQNDDVLRGGGGPDQFVFDANMGRDRIIDFNRTLDRLTLDLDLFVETDPAAIVLERYFGTNIDGDLVLVLGNGNSLVFEGLTQQGDLGMAIDYV